MSRILVVDDERAICQAFVRMLGREGHQALVAATAEEALEAIRGDPPEVVFLDVRLPGMSGIQALEVIHREHPRLPVILMTAHGDMETALEALRLGAFDYLGKPLDLSRIREALARALRNLEMREEGDLAPPQPPAPAGTGGPIGRSPAMQEVFKLIALLKDNDLSVLISGETGVGKELVARALHEHGNRAAEPFVAVNCAAIPEHLLESELFGHERGAFTGAVERRIGRIEAAGAGTLFLDEIGDLQPALQVKLLRLLQERSFERLGSHHSLPLDARVLAATHQDLGRRVEEGRFRADLYHRLNIVELHIPPLRERPEDIPVLARHFLAQANRRLHKALRDLEPAALEALQGYPWPGNVRELEHLIQRSALLAAGPLLTRADLRLPAAAELPAGLRKDPLESLAGVAEATLRDLVRAGRERPFNHIVERVEGALVTTALEISGGNQVAAARLLGINRTTLRKKAEAGKRSAAQ